MTLRENRLKTLAGGQILASQACLIGNRPGAPGVAGEARADPGDARADGSAAPLARFLLDDRQHPGESAEAVARRVTAHPEVAGLRGPTIARVYPKAGGDEGWFAVTVVVDSKLLISAVDALRRARAPRTSRCSACATSSRASPGASRRCDDSLSGEAVEEAVAVALTRVFDDLAEARRELLSRRALGVGRGARVDASPAARDLRTRSDARAGGGRDPRRRADAVATRRSATTPTRIDGQRLESLEVDRADLGAGRP